LSEEKVVYLYYKNEQFQPLKDKEIISSFIRSPLEEKEYSGTYILTIGREKHYNACEFLVWGTTSTRVACNYENGLKTILTNMSASEEDEDFKKSLTFTLNHLQTQDVQLYSFFIQVGEHS